MKNRPSLLLATILLLYLSSCSVQTNFIQPNRRTGEEPNKTEHTSVNASKDNTLINITPKIFDDVKHTPIKPQPRVKVNKRVLCSSFVPPEIPDSPRVDLTKLQTIPAGDHEAVKDMLIDNIKAMNTHAKQVEELIREAYKKHRATCSTREIVTGHEK